MSIIFIVRSEWECGELVTENCFAHRKIEYQIANRPSIWIFRLWMPSFISVKNFRNAKHCPAIANKLTRKWIGSSSLLYDLKDNDFTIAYNVFEYGLATESAFVLLFILFHFSKWKWPISVIVCWLFLFSSSSSSYRQRKLNNLFETDATLFHYNIIICENCMHCVQWRKDCK